MRISESSDLISMWKSSLQTGHLLSNILYAGFLLIWKEVFMSVVVSDFGSPLWVATIIECSEIQWSLTNQYIVSGYDDKLAEELVSASPHTRLKYQRVGLFQRGEVEDSKTPQESEFDPLPRKLAGQKQDLNGWGGKPLSHDSFMKKKNQV